MASLFHVRAICASLREGMTLNDATGWHFQAWPEAAEDDSVRALIDEWTLEHEERLKRAVCERESSKEEDQHPRKRPRNN